MAVFGRKALVNPFGKMSIFRLFALLFRNIVKNIFLEYIASKKKLEEMAIFGPKPRVNPFGKMLIFRLFKLLFFIA